MIATDVRSGTRILLCGALLVAGLLLTPAWADDPCQECHGQIGLGVAGQPLWLHPEALAASVHSKLACSDCHKGADGFPHGADLRVRCDLRCHVPGTGHAATAQEVAGGAHATLGHPPCVACHDGAAAPERALRTEQCRNCHPGLEPARELYPDSPGAFGFHAHRSVPDKQLAPDCVDCHGAHGVTAGTGARAACASAACHPKEGEAFGQLFDHRPTTGVRPWGGVGTVVTSLLGLVAAVLALHALRG